MTELVRTFSGVGRGSVTASGAGTRIQLPTETEARIRAIQSVYRKQRLAHLLPRIADRFAELDAVFVAGFEAFDSTVEGRKAWALRSFDAIVAGRRP